MATVTLPNGILPVTVAPEDGRLETVREIRFRFDLLDNQERLIGELNGVDPGGSLEWTAGTAIKGSGSILVQDLPEHEFDWLDIRIKPYILVTDDAGEMSEDPLGVFIPTVPTAHWTDEQRSWDVQLQDKLVILDQDTIITPDGEPQTYQLDAGANVITAVKAIIVDAGETAVAIEDDPDATLETGQAFEVGTTRLKIINELLETANYFSLSVDGNGQYRTRPYKRPAERTPVYSAETPFADAAHSLMTPDFSVTSDIFGVPNRYWALQQSTGESEGNLAVATNEDPDSPFSFPSRGRWITEGEKGVEATDQAALQSYAERKLDELTSVTTTVDLAHLYLPRINIENVVLMRAGEVDTLTVVTQTSVPLDSESVCTTGLRKVARPNAPTQ